MLLAKLQNDILVSRCIIVNGKIRQDIFYTPTITYSYPRWVSVRNRVNINSFDYEAGFSAYAHRPEQGRDGRAIETLNTLII